MTILFGRAAIAKFMLQILTVTLVLAVRVCFAYKTPASFVFGDSLVDVGNNNNMVSAAKANFLPNGIDMGEPTGRFTNGKTVIDLIGQDLGLRNFTPPFMDPKTSGDMVMQGVNYASGAAGILNRTGYDLGARINMEAQLDNFGKTREYIISRIGEGPAQELFGKNSIFSVIMGSNDFLNNYMLPILSEPQRNLVSPEAFVQILMATYKLQLTRLYNLGARKVVVSNIGPLGCMPYMKDRYAASLENGDLDGDGCVIYPNKLVKLFNTNLKTLVTELTANLDGSDFVYADVYHITEDILAKYASNGFANTKSACCYAIGRYGGMIPCGPWSRTCADRSKYVFWDPYHPTEAFNVLVAKRLINGDSHDISPKNIRQLLQQY